jgi:hypothetical protein
MPSREEYTKNYPAAAAAPAPVAAVPAAADAPHTFHRDAARQLLDHGIEQLVFVRRYTLSADHVYTEHVNSRWMPGGGLCILDLRPARCGRLRRADQHGVVNRFDVSFDARGSSSISNAPPGKATGCTR